MPAPATNEAVADILYRCLAPRPEDRPTAAQVRDVLTGRGASAPVAATTTEPAAAPATAPAAVPPAAPPPATPAVTVDAPPVAPPVAAPPPVEPAAVAPAAVPAGGAPLTSDRIQLIGESGHSMSLGVRTPLGKHIVRQFGEDSNVWDSEQLVVERGADGTWQVTPAAGTTNETLVNGEAVTAPRPLRDGDVIAVGRAAKGIARLPLTARPA
jgi:hypothetical protein